MRLLLFSGGVESTCLALMHQPDLLLTIDYGHRPADGERRAATFIANQLGLRHDVMTTDISALGAGDLAGVRPIRDAEAPETWPFRNQFFITLAAMRYVRDGLREILIGTVATDRIHPDGTPEFLGAVEKLLQCEAPGLRVRAPAIKMDTLVLVKKAGLSDELLGWTFSCHRAAIACGQCRGCQKTIELKQKLKR